jgi:hypothetical protein
MIIDEMAYDIQDEEATGITKERALTDDCQGSLR